MADFETLRTIYQTNPNAISAIKKVLDVAMNEVGYGIKIQTGGKRPNQYAEYIQTNHYDNKGSEHRFYNSPKKTCHWCAIFVDYCYLRAFGFDTTKKITNQGGSKDCGAGVPHSINYFKQIDRYIPKSTHTDARQFITPGCEIFFDWGKDGKADHTGLVLAVLSKDKVLTIEGNTAWQNVEKKKVYLQDYNVPQSIVQGIKKGSIYPGSEKTSSCVSFKVRNLSDIIGVGFPKYEETEGAYSSSCIGINNSVEQAVPYVYFNNKWNIAVPYIVAKNPVTKELFWTTGSVDGIDYSKIDNTGGKLVKRVLSRNGKYFYGTSYSRNIQNNVYSAARPSRAQMEINAKFIYKYFSNKGWTKESISAMLGNMQTESLLNPGLWEGGKPKDSSGFGLVQWTKSTVFINWAKEANLTTFDYSDIFYQCEKIMCEKSPSQSYVNEYGKKYPINELNTQFFSSSRNYNNYKANLTATWSQCQEINTFSEFSKSTWSPKILSDIFLTNYLRPASSRSAPTRAEQAQEWYDFL